MNSWVEIQDLAFPTPLARAQQGQLPWMFQKLAMLCPYLDTAVEEDMHTVVPQHFQATT